MSLHPRCLASPVPCRRLLFRAIPDVQKTVLEQDVMRGNRIVTSWRLSGTHTGPYYTKISEGCHSEIPPSGRQLQIYGISIDECQGDKIVNLAIFFDSALMRQQLGYTDVTAPADPARRPVVRLLLYLRMGTVKALTRIHIGAVTGVQEREADAIAQMERRHTGQFLLCVSKLIGDSFCLASSDGDDHSVLLCSHSFASTLGVDTSAIVGRSFLGLFEEVFGGETPQLMSAMATALSSRKSLQVVARGKRADGQMVGVVLCMVPFVSDRDAYWSCLLCDLRCPPPQRLLAKAAWKDPWGAGAPRSDIDLGSCFIHKLPTSWLRSNSKKLEMTLSDAVDALGAGCTICDCDGVDKPIVWVSRGFGRVTGMSTAQCIGKSYHFLTTISSDPEAVNRIQKAIEHAEHVRVHLWQKPPGEQGFWGLLSVHPFTVDGKLRYLVCVLLKLDSLEVLQVCKLKRDLELNEREVGVGVRVEAALKEAAAAESVAGIGHDRQVMLARMRHVVTQLEHLTGSTVSSAQVVQALVREWPELVHLMRQQG